MLPLNMCLFYGSLRCTWTGRGICSTAESAAPRRVCSTAACATPGRVSSTAVCAVPKRMSVLWQPTLYLDESVLQ
jgi:hypothetical protein